MRQYFERVLITVTALCGGRFLLPLVLTGLVISYGWISSPAPLPERDGRLRLRQQWQQLMPLQTALQSDIPDEMELQHFSPMAVPIAGVALESWHPAGRGGELLLTVRWAAVPLLFSWLAGCEMRVAAFSLHSEQGKLQMSLQLEQEDAG